MSKIHVDRHAACHMLANKLLKYDFGPKFSAAIEVVSSLNTVFLLSSIELRHKTILSSKISIFKSSDGILLIQSKIHTTEFTYKRGFTV